MALLEGTSLRLVDTSPLLLVIYNPARPDRGQVEVSLDIGYVTWLHQHTSADDKHTDYFGHLEGITPDIGGDASQDRPVPGVMIIHLLTAATD